LPSWCFPFCQLQIAKRRAPLNCTSLSIFINSLHVYGCSSYCPTFSRIIDCPLPKIYSFPAQTSTHKRSTWFSGFLIRL
jgi:hypothetical protein